MNCSKVGTKRLCLGTNRLGAKDPWVRNDWIANTILTQCWKHPVSCSVPVRAGTPEERDVSSVHRHRGIYCGKSCLSRQRSEK